MTGLTAGTTVRALDFPPTLKVSSPTDNNNQTSTTYITGSPTISTTFTAPTSGRVRFIVSVSGRDDSGDNRIFVAVQVFTGTSASGTEILSPSVATAVSTQGEGSNFCTFERCSFLDGLTPGDTYFARLMHRVTGGTTCDVSYRGLIIVPLT
jgi:hypothetical protein